MKKILFSTLTLTLLLSACGPSEQEIKEENEKTIKQQKERIDELFEPILSISEYNVTDLDQHENVKKISLYLNADFPEVVEYAQAHIDLIPVMQDEINDRIYGDLFDYAEEHGWNDVSKEEAQKLEDAIEVKGDEFSTSVIYRDPSSPKYVNYNGFFLYYTFTGTLPPDMKLRFQYADDDWLFVKSAELSIDGKLEYITISDWERDHSYGDIYEWGTAVNPEYSLIIDIIKSKSTKIRYRGNKYYDDRTVTSSQKKALENVMKAYYCNYLKDVES